MRIEECTGRSRKMNSKTERGGRALLPLKINEKRLILFAQVLNGEKGVDGMLAVMISPFPC